MNLLYICIKHVALCEQVGVRVELKESICMCTHFLKIVNLIIVQGVKAAVKTCKPISLYLNAMRLPLPPGNEDNSYTGTSHFQHCGSILPNDQV